MSDGIRIMAMDPILRGATIEVPHPSRMVFGAPKIYRIRLDGEGAALVSEVVWARIKEIVALDPTAPNFIEVGRTARPPTQTVGGLTENRPLFVHLPGYGITAKGAVSTAQIVLKG